MLEIATFGLPKHHDGEDRGYVEAEDCGGFMSRVWPGLVGLDENFQSGTDLTFLLIHATRTLE